MTQRQFVIAYKPKDGVVLVGRSRMGLVGAAVLVVVVRGEVVPVVAVRGEVVPDAVVLDAAVLVELGAQIVLAD